MSATPSAPTRPKITGLSNMTFYARDVQETVAFYNDILGYNDVLLQDTGGADREPVYVRINPRQYIELVSEHQPQSDRMVQYGFEVDDAEALRRYLASHGITVPDALSEAPTGALRFHINDPDGHTVEFIQYVPGCWPINDMLPAGAWRRGPNPGSGAASVPISNCMMHIGFTVYSLEKSMKLYRDILGFREMWRGSSDGKTLSWVQLKLPDDKNYIEFMLYGEPPSLQQLGILNHYGLEVPSVPESVASLDSVPAFAEYPRTVEHKVGTCRHRLSNLFDPDGTRAELMERATFDGSVTPSSDAPPPR